MASDLSRRLQILTGTLFVVCLSSPRLAHTAVRYDGDAIVRLHGDWATHRRILGSWGIEPWRDHPNPTAPLLHVPAAARPQLDISGLTYEVLEPDLQSALDRARDRPPTLPGEAEDFFADFRPLGEIEAQLDAWEDEFGKRVTPIDVGTSLQGRTIRAIRICDEEEDLPVVLINATQHAREWISTSSTMYLARTLVESDDATVDALRSELAFVIVPVANPDGYVFTWEEDRLWRKNRRDGHGVDLNRNWPVAWGGQGSSGDPASNNYRGAAALSEPEAAALAELAAGLSPLVAHVDVHAYGQLVLSPWSFGLDEAPDDAQLLDLGETMATAMAAVEGSDYLPIPAAELYPASGTLPDYTYGTLGARAFTFELRPQDAEPHAAGFVPGVGEIEPTGEEALAAVLALGAAVVDTRPLAPGDDGDAPVEPASTGSSSDGDGDSSTGGGGSTSGTTAPDAGSSDEGAEVGDGAGTSEGATNDDVTDASCACSSRGGSGPRGWFWLATVWLVPGRVRARARR